MCDSYGGVVAIVALFFTWQLRKSADSIDNHITADWYQKLQQRHKRAYNVGFLEYMPKNIYELDGLPYELAEK